MRGARASNVACVRGVIKQDKAASVQKTIAVFEVPFRKFVAVIAVDVSEAERPPKPTVRPKTSLTVLCLLHSEKNSSEKASMVYGR